MQNSHVPPRNVTSYQSDQFGDEEYVEPDPFFMSPEEYSRAFRRKFKARAPMEQLPLKYQPVKGKKKPPLLHFGFPVTFRMLYAYGAKHGLTEYYKHEPTTVCITTAFNAIARLEKVCQYDICMEMPFMVTKGCQALIELYSNFDEYDKKLVPEDEKDVIDILRKELGIDESVQPMWYFDALDPYQPGDEDNEDDEDDEEGEEDE